jgi:predicted nucleotide-binding protein
MAKMTRKEPEVGYPEIDPRTGIDLLNKQIEAGKTLLSSRPISSDNYSTWELVTKNVLEKAFGKNTDNVRSITDVGKYGAFPMNAGEAYWENERFDNLGTQITKMEGLIKVLELELPLVRAEKAFSSEKKKVFIVHGHNDAILHESARFIETLGLEVIVLREQPNSGRTIIEKFEDYSDVGFAIVLLTDDDIGGEKGLSIDKMKSRARQNVIFELGYFIGVLERSNVCALYEKGVELPSDFSGILYTEIDNGGMWKFNLAKELKASGYAIDMNKLA